MEITLRISPKVVLVQVDDCQVEIPEDKLAAFAKKAFIKEEHPFGFVADYKGDMLDFQFRPNLITTNWRSENFDTWTKKIATKRKRIVLK